MPFITYRDTRPQPRDTQVDTLRKIVQRLGGSPSTEDTESTLLVKVLVRLGGVQVFPTDTEAVTLQKILQQFPCPPSPCPPSPCPPCPPCPVDVNLNSGAMVISGQTFAHGVHILSNSSVTSLVASSLQIVDFEIDIALLSSLTSINFSGLKESGDTTFTQLPLLTSLSLPSYVRQRGGLGLFITQNLTLASVSIPNLVSTESTFIVQDNPLLTTLTLSSYLPHNGDSLDMNNNALNQVSVDLVLARCVANAAFVSGSVNLSGGTNATPSVAGLANKAILIGRGVMVTTN